MSEANKTILIDARQRLRDQSIRLERLREMAAEDGGAGIALALEAIAETDQDLMKQLTEALAAEAGWEVAYSAEVEQRNPALADPEDSAEAVAAFARDALREDLRWFRAAAKESSLAPEAVAVLKAVADGIARGISHL